MSICASVFLSLCAFVCSCDFYVFLYVFLCVHVIFIWFYFCVTGRGSGEYDEVQVRQPNSAAAAAVAVNGGGKACSSLYCHIESTPLLSYLKEINGSLYEEMGYVGKDTKINPTKKNVALAYFN